MQKKYTGKELRKIVGYTGINVTFLSKKLNISRKTIYNIFNSEKPNQKYVDDILNLVDYQEKKIDGIKLSELSIADLYALKKYSQWLYDEYEDVYNLDEWVKVSDDFFHIQNEVDSELLKRVKTIDFNKELNIWE